MIEKKEYNFAWGNPYFLLEILDRQYTQSLVLNDIKSMAYGPDEGLEETIDAVRYTIKKTMGLEYKHILITNGATQGINTILRCLAKNGAKHVLTGKYGYPYYGNMIEKAGLNRIKGLDSTFPATTTIKLIDSPCNPFGEQVRGSWGTNTVWDSVYHNNVYTNNLTKKPSHSVMVGSFTKLLGIAGARVGYIATNSEKEYKMYKNESLYDLATISIPSQNLIIDILNNIDLDDFVKRGNLSLCDNREEFSKIRHIFDNQQVQETGMFYCVKADKKAIDLLDKCGIIFIRLDDEYIRLSLGQTNNLTKNAINAILKGDRR